MLPTIFKKGAFIIQADKIGLGSPAQPVTHVDRRGTAARKLLFAMRAVMFFIKVFFTGI
jgi:hypothetical protein